VPWRILAADVLMGGAAALFGLWLFHRLAARVPIDRGPAKRLVRHGWVILVVVVLLNRRLYGPPIRLLLTAKLDRPAQRFADRVARSPELREWARRRTAALRASGETDEMLPRSLTGERSELARDGVGRLADPQLRLRTSILAEAFAHADRLWPCTTLVAGDERAVPEVLRQLPATSEAWFGLIYEAMIAEARASPPRRRLTDEQRAVVLADLRQSNRPARHPFEGRPTESGSNRMRARCARERALYAAVNTWDGPRRAAADLLLATADSRLAGELDRPDDE